MPEIRVSREAARGCGVRKPGGLYLVAGNLSEPCPRLPLPLDRCPHCGQGVGPARGWTWITPNVLFPASRHGTAIHNAVCPLGLPPEDLLQSLAAQLDTPIEQYHRTGTRAGLIWIGEQFYKTARSFMDEAAEMGVSRRIKAVPKGFTLGQWVYLAHRKAVDHSRYMTVEEAVAGWHPEDGSVISSNDDALRILEGSGERFTPGVMTLFQPTAIEYIVKGDETIDELTAFEKRGISLVKVKAALPHLELPMVMEGPLRG